MLNLSQKLSVKIKTQDEKCNKNYIGTHKVTTTSIKNAISWRIKLNNVISIIRL